MDPITLTPSTPLVVSTTTTQTFVSFVVTRCSFDLSEGSVTLTVNKTDSDGVMHTDILNLSTDQATTFMTTAATVGQVLVDLGSQAAQAAVVAYYGLTL